MVADTHVNRAAYLTAQMGLVGWTNLRDEDGADVPFKGAQVSVGGAASQGASDESMDRLPFDAILELAAEVQRRGETTEQSAKA
jgi:hypothetical protein